MSDNCYDLARKAAPAIAKMEQDQKPVLDNSVAARALAKIKSKSPAQASQIPIITRASEGKVVQFPRPEKKARTRKNLSQLMERKDFVQNKNAWKCSACSWTWVTDLVPRACPVCHGGILNPIDLNGVEAPKIDQLEKELDQTIQRLRGIISRAELAIAALERK